ncbi:MAG: prepilin-type N-terminal cleavage/methylation domain-containing protein [bacterium]|nr:prepilin-type N-terminal cleavage/methylation domain-containing protein [bacterium]
MKKSFQKQRGFSLVEMLVYITVLVFMLVIIIQVVVSLTKSDRIIKSLRNIENSAVLGIERISREMREAESINVGESILGTHPGKLVLQSTDQSGNPRTVEFYLSSGQLILKENAVVLGPLTGSDAEITGLIFNRFSGTNSEGVRVEMTIESGTSTAYRTKKFYSTSIIR